ncbi:MAG: hypothetical protein EOP58_00710 [Sphingomonadales bacterium]|nr:MAG: hypothetical protein EOP58_00710 [Sphingomonadales bacterium]
MTDPGNAAQVRMVAEQVAEATIKRFTQEHLLPPVKAEMPATLKLWGSIGAAVLTLVVTSGVIWGVSTLNALQITVARMDERQQQDTTGARLEKIEERLSTLEQIKRGAE